MLVTEARALCAELRVLPWDDHVLSAAITAGTAALVRVSPQVSPVAGAPGMWWVAVGSRLSAPGSRPSHESRVASHELQDAAGLQAIASAWHPRARVAIADSCMAARAATWSRARSLVTVIPPGGDADFVATAPLSLLPMDAEMRDALHALGVRTVGGFADLDAGDVEQRWGDDGLSAWRLAHGEDPRRPVLARLDAQPHAEMELATPAATMEPVLFLVRPAIEHLVTYLVSQSRAIAALSVTLTLDDARGPMPDARPHTVTREIRMPRPLARAAPLFERCRGLLARWELSAPVTAVRLTVVLSSPLTGEQGNLLDTSWRDPGAADAALERVRAELGPGVVVKPVAVDGYTPERSGRWAEEMFSAGPAGQPPFSAGPPGQPPFSAGPPGPIGFSAAPAAPIGRHSASQTTATAENSLRILETPERIEVDADVPRRLTWRGRDVRVAHAMGPERLSGDWWSDGYQRDYWRCERADDAGDLVLYRDAAGWWVQGWYD